MRSTTTQPGVQPRVTVVMPVLNEERHIDACLRAIMAQDYPSTLMDVIVVDGMSTDRTAEIVRARAAEDSRIRLLCNPKRRTPYSMNIGLAAAIGEVLVRIDGHSVVDPGHVRRCVDFLLASNAEHIGGLLRAHGTTAVGRAIALAMSSPFGVGSARFRYASQEQDVDTVPFGAYYRESLLRLGGFDVRFLICQDSELDFRILRGGGRVRLTPTIVTEYACRDSWSGLARQFFGYGRGKGYMLHKHRGLPSLRAVGPAALLTCLASLLLAAPFFRWARWAFAGTVACYTVACLVASATIAAKRGWRHLTLLPITFMVLHCSHGAGFLCSLPRFFSPRPVERIRGSLTTEQMDTTPPAVPHSMDDMA